MEYLPTIVDPIEWDKALRACRTMHDSSEQDWASWKCEGGPHNHTDDQLNEVPTVRQSTSIRISRIIDLTD